MNLYKAPKEYPCIVVYPTEKQATKSLFKNHNSILGGAVAVHVRDPDKNTAVLSSLAFKHMKYVSEKSKVNLFCTMPGDIVLFLLKQRTINNVEFWYVLIGERSGWIIVPEWLKMEYVV
jgi:hypothetical protein